MAGDTEEHYVDMHDDGDGMWWAVLPAPLPGIGAIETRVTVDGVEVDAARERVVDPVCISAEMSLQQSSAAMRIVVGATRDKATFPRGFACEGVVGLLSASGVAIPSAICTGR